MSRFCTLDIKAHTHSQLNDEDHLCLAFKNIFKSHDVLMLKALKDLHLLLHALPLQTKPASCTSLQFQEFTCPQNIAGSLPHLTHLPEVTTRVAIDSKNRIEVSVKTYKTLANLI